MYFLEKVDDWSTNKKGIMFLEIVNVDNYMETLSLEVRRWEWLIFER